MTDVRVETHRVGLPDADATHPNRVQSSIQHEFEGTTRIDAFLAERHNLILAGIRKDGRPQRTPNWFLWEAGHFYVSTTRHRAKYAIFRRDPRAQMIIDDPIGFRAVVLSATVAIRDDVAAELSRFRAIKAKYGLTLPSEAEDLRSHRDEGRVLLVISPDGSPPTWITWGLEDPSEADDEQH